MYTAPGTAETDPEICCPGELSPLLTWTVLLLSLRYSGFLKGLLQVFSHIAGGVAPTVAGFFISQVR